MNYKWLTVFCKLALAVYFMALCYVLFYQVGGTDRETYFRNPDDHLLPFHSTYDMIKNIFVYRNTSHSREFQIIFLMNIWGNLVLLLPWGLLAPVVFKKLNFFKGIAVSGLLISLTAETGQYCFKLGVFDIDDLMYNTLGAIFGFYLFRAITFFLQKYGGFKFSVAEQEQYKQEST